MNIDQSHPASCLRRQSRREFVKMSALLGSIYLFPGSAPGQIRSRAKPGEAGFPPGVDPDNPLLALGLLDITQAPYMADPAGTGDSTDAIQRAVNDARDHGLVCFFPEGAYLISDTISCEQEVYKLDEPRGFDEGTQHYWDRPTPMVLVGSTKGKRPVIRLASGATGFGNHDKPKFAVHIWAQTRMDAPGSDEPEWGMEQPNIAFDHIFKGIDLDIRGHAGAIGVRFSGAQGSTMQDMTVQADGAYAGLSDCPGQGGGTHNITVNGGRHGILIDTRSRFPLLNACTFRGQSASAVRYTGEAIQVPTLLVGCRIETDSTAAVDMSAQSSHGGITLLDSIVSVQNGGVLADTRACRNIFMENVHLRGAENIYRGGPKLPPAGPWTRVERFSSHDSGCANLVNGTLSEGDITEWSSADSAPDYESLRDRHYSGTPSFEDQDAVNVKDFGAVGDGDTNDIAAFRQALKKSDKIFVPLGTFKIQGSLQLGPSTQIFGMSRRFCVLSGGGGRGIRRAFPASEPEMAAFRLDTADCPQAEPGIYFLSIRGEVAWKSGRGTWMLGYGSPRITGNGGGRFYALTSIRRKLELNDIRQPTSFYALNVERVLDNPQSEIRDCEHVRIYYFKVEAGTILIVDNPEDANTPCRIDSCRDIRIYCNYGNVRRLGERPMLDVAGSSDVLVSQLKAFKPDGFPHVRENWRGVISEIPTNKSLALYVRD